MTDDVDRWLNAYLKRLGITVTHDDLSGEVRDAVLETLRVGPGTGLCFSVLADLVVQATLVNNSPGRG